MELLLSSDTRNLAQVEPFLASVIRHLLDENRYYNAVIALTEAVNNAIVHGNKKDMSKSVHIAVCVDDTHIVLTVRDEGQGFDIDTLPDPLHPDNLLRDGGRGVFLIRQLVDESMFEQTPHGMLTTMRITR
jgi:serine/threonine-protein kinase RsbW